MTESKFPDWLNTALTLCIALALSIPVAGCKQIDDAITSIASPLVQAAVNDKTADLTAQLIQQAQGLQAVKQKLEALEKKVALNQKIQELSADLFTTESATVTSDCEGYAIARTDIGAVIVACESLQPYLDGFKIRLLLTTLVPISLSGLKITVAWQEDDAKFFENGVGYRRKEVNSLLKFEPGRYTAVDVQLSPASSSGVKRLTVGVRTDRISVLPPRQQ